MKTKQKINYKIRSLILCLEAHPDYEPDSEFADRLSDLHSLQEDIYAYATEAIKADREKMSSITRIWEDERYPNWRTLRESILNLPIDLP